MSDNTSETELELTTEELEAQAGEELPDRKAMSGEREPGGSYQRRRGPQRGQR